MIIMLRGREQQQHPHHAAETDSLSWSGYGQRYRAVLTVSEEVSLSRHVVRKHSTADAYGPEELVDVV